MGRHINTDFHADMNQTGRTSSCLVDIAVWHAAVVSQLTAALMRMTSGSEAQCSFFSPLGAISGPMRLTAIDGQIVSKCLV